jgi:hypothetical protein
MGGCWAGLTGSHSIAITQAALLGEEHNSSPALQRRGQHALQHGLQGRCAAAPLQVPCV